MSECPFYFMRFMQREDPFAKPLMSLYHFLRFYTTPYFTSTTVIFCAVTSLLLSTMSRIWATCAAERFAVPAVVVNPAVHPQQLLHHFLGEQRNPYSGRSFTLLPEHMQVLAALDHPTLAHPERFWLLQQSGDEVLDYRVAIDYYRASRVTLETGGNHAFTGFERHCPEIVRFLQL